LPYQKWERSVSHFVLTSNIGGQARLRPNREDGSMSAQAVNPG
jgi:hypothetical protein